MLNMQLSHAHHMIQLCKIPYLHLTNIFKSVVVEARKICLKYFKTILSNKRKWLNFVTFSFYSVCSLNKSLVINSMIAFLRENCL